MEQELFENVASIVLFTEYTIISRENWTATFFILLTFSSLNPSCNILGLMGWKVVEQQDVNTQSKSNSREHTASI